MTTKIKKTKNNTWTNRAKAAAGQPVTKRAEKKYDSPGRPKKNPTMTVSVRVQWQNYDRLKAIVKATDKLSGTDFGLLRLLELTTVMAEKHPEIVRHMEQSLLDFAELNPQKSPVE